MKVAMPMLCRLNTRLNSSSTAFTIMYRVPNGIGISLSRPLISD